MIIILIGKGVVAIGRVSKMALINALDSMEQNTIENYSKEIEEGTLKYESYQISKGDSIDYLIYNHIERNGRCLEEVRYDISNLNAALGNDIHILYPGNVIYLPVYSD